MRNTVPHEMLRMQSSTGRPLATSAVSVGGSGLHQDSIGQGHPGLECPWPGGLARPVSISSLI